MKIFIITMGVFIFFVGCAPQYAIKNQYIPPIKSKSNICLKNCALDKQACQTRCEEDYSDCLSYANERAKKIQVRSDENYKKRYARYLTRLNDYNLNIFDWQNRYDERYSDWKYFNDKCSKNGDKYACDREEDLRYIIRKLKINRPREPREPRYISFDEILAKQQKTCSRKCGCQDNYDSCFLSCGGEIVPHKICVKNCD